MDFTYKRQDWPWVWALRETELLCLEWKEGCTAKELKEIEKLQNLLPTEIIDHVYIGTQLCAHNVDRLLKLGITHVLNVGGVTERGPVEEYKNNNIVYGELGAKDTEGYPLLENHMTTAHAFIELARKHKPAEGICMVYCEGGLNRSGLVVAAETMMSGEMSVLEAVANLREKRGEYALCNDSFQEQLVALARSCDLLGEKPGTPGSLVEQTPPPEPEREIANPAAATTTTAAASTDESSSSSRIEIRVREPQQQSNAQSATATATTPATPSATTPAGEKQRKPELVTPSPPTGAAPTTNSTRTAASSLSSAVVVSSPEDNNDGDAGVEEEVIEEEIILEDEYEEEVIGHVEDGEEEDVVEYDEEEVILEEDDDEYVVEEEVVLPDEENRNSGKMAPPAWGYESEYLEVEVLDYEIVSPSSRQNKVNKDLAYMWDWDPNVRSPRSPSSPSGTANNTTNNNSQQQKQPQRGKGKGGNNNNNNKARRHSSSEGDLDYILEWTPGDSPPKSPTAKQKIDENNTKVPQLEKLVEEPTEVEGSDG